VPVRGQGWALVACALALCAAGARAQDLEANAPGPAPDLAALAVAVSRTPAAEIPALVASDPRFAALDGGARLHLVEAVRIPEWHRLLASALNVYPSFGVGSLTQGDWSGAATAAGLEAAGGLLWIAGAQLSDGGAVGPGTVLLVAAGSVAIGAGIGYGVVRSWRWEGRRQVALRQSLFPAPPQAAARPPPRAPAPRPDGLALPIVCLRF
jgi:hypothetical protein